MHLTLFDTPVLKTLLRILAKITLFCFGWKSMGSKPEEKKYVIIAAPHTSNWDLFFMMLIALDLKIAIYWMGKDSIFGFPFKHLMHWMGGISVNRSQANDLVSAMVKTFEECDELVLSVPPEGTRSHTVYWKTGFYHIANGAGIPICLGYLDFAKKEGGIGPMFYPTGDIDKDMTEIKTFYKDITGKYPNRFESPDDYEQDD
jgi:1-acyl-sn-glycerol-3-phosphate acyltransferase